MPPHRSRSQQQPPRRQRRQSTAASNYSDLGSITSTSVYSDISFDGATSAYTNGPIFDSPPPSEYAPLSEHAWPEDRTLYEHDDTVVICEFVNLLGCDAQFYPAEADVWKQHMIDHMGGRLPQQSGCPLCSRWTCDAETMGGNEDAAFHRRFEHILHHFRSNRTWRDIGSDRKLLEFMFQNGVISEDVYLLVSYPGGQLRPQARIEDIYEGESGVGEETVVTETSRRRDRRDRRGTFSSLWLRPLRNVEPEWRGIDHRRQEFKAD